MEYSGCPPTLLNTLAERTCFSFPLLHLIFSYYAEGCVASCMRDRIIGYFPLAERTCFSQGVKRILISDPYLSLSFTIKGTGYGAKHLRHRGHSSRFRPFAAGNGLPANRFCESQRLIATAE